MFSVEKLKQVKTIIKPQLPTMKNNQTTPWYKKWGWMLLIWLGSIVSLAVVATVFKLLMYGAGMRTH